MEIKYHIVFDKNIKSSKIRKIIEKKIKISNINKASIIIVVGGDGFMLKTLKKLHQKNLSMELILEIMVF